ncbi:Gfo/Idh/MocA family protein [Isoptericola sp. BMS4]|uniref:Gfo/Idh/MocA family protein n=1 Tax=Isoptericola sp. BMS4 TaxID=2527875 RepID=UPI001421AC18|nr:Gfo/Idh/MocA family oxidoreductase [Isoptericola sp. BMS4]
MGRDTGTDTVGIGVVGAGKIARNYHLPALARATGARLVAVADVDEDAARGVAAEFDVPRVHRSHESLLASPDVDAVVVLTTYHPKKQIIADAIDAGTHVFTQKPLAGSVADAEELVTLAERRGVRFVPSFMHNYFPETRLARELLTQGRIGDVVGYRQRNATRNKVAGAVRLGGATWDIGPHGVAMIEHLLGERILAVQCRMDGFGAGGDRPATGPRGWPVDLVAAMNYTTESGVVVSHEVQWTSQGGVPPWRTELYGTHGAISVRADHAPSLLALALSDPEAPEPGAWQYLEVPDEPKGLFHHQRFVDDVRLDEHQSATGADGLAALRVVDAAYRSAETGETVVLPAAGAAPTRTTTAAH